jgi:hypothetical protein
VIDYVTDPRSGLPSSCSFLPTVKEVRDACDARMLVLEVMARPTPVAKPFQPPPKMVGQLDWKEYQEQFPGKRPIGRFERVPE